MDPALNCFRPFPGIGSLAYGRSGIGPDFGVVAVNPVAAFEELLLGTYGGRRDKRRLLGVHVELKRAAMKVLAFLTVILDKGGRRIIIAFHRDPVDRRARFVGPINGSVDANE